MIGNYLLGIIAVSLFSGIFRALFSKSTYEKWINLLLGVLLVISVIKPVVNLDITRNIPDLDVLYADADGIAAQGSAAADSAMNERIIQQLDAHMQDKAASLGASLSFSFQMEKGVPCGVSVTGNVTPYTKTQLSHWIASELGIPKEAQNWN